jgi:hypothetical protein
MKFQYPLVMLFVLVGYISQAQTNYFIDQVSGNDANSGTSVSSPWKNLTKIYNLTLTAGSTINLKSGSVWTSQQIKFKGSGTSANSIVVTSYGSGAKPIIHGNGITGQGVVYLYNQQYIEINNLEITNTPNTPNDADFFVGLFDNTVSVNPNPLAADRRGVMVAIDNFGTANHIYLKNLNVHHVKGQLGNGNSSVNGAIPKRTGGIYFTVLDTLETTSKNSRFNDVLIDSCNIYYCENNGIALDNEWNVYYPGGQNSSVAADQTEYANWYNRRFSSVWIKNNTLHHIGKNAMIIRCTDETGLIEKNVCYETALGTTGNTMFTARAKGTVFQYNEGYYNRATTQTVDPGVIDGSMYDPDFGSVGIIFQYSYSHDNSQGIYWGCNTRSATTNTTGIPDPGDIGCTLRYCVSQNDLGDLVFLNYSSAGNEIYNNVFYIKSGINPNIIHENSGNNHTYNFFNNIIYNLSSAITGADYAFGSGTGVQTRNISNNTFYGSHHATEPTDPFKLITSPLFLGVGTGGTGINTVSGYKLRTGSPALNSGKLISNNGGFDYFGNAVSSTTVPNRGIYQRSGVSTTVPTAISMNCGAATFSAAAVANTVYSGTATVPYIGENSIAYSAGSAIASTGVTGLNAVLQAGTSVNGEGTLTYNITGTPLGGGNANFALSFGGQTCTLTMAINYLTQTITFDPLPLKSIGGADFAPGATTSSDLTVTYSSSNASVATIVNNMIHVVGSGITIITASQSGNGIYKAATNVNQNFIVRTNYSYSPSNTNVSFGTGCRCKAGALISNNSDYYTVKSTTTGTRKVDWYGSVTINQPINTVNKLTINYDGNNSVSKTQDLFLYDWTISSWTLINSSNVSSTDVTVNYVTTTNFANYISSTGEIRLRVYSTGGTTNYVCAGDWMQFVIESSQLPGTLKNAISNTPQDFNNAFSQELVLKSDVLKAENIVEYYLKKQANVLITLCDEKGTPIKILNESDNDAGSHRFKFNTKEYKAGSYQLSLKAGQYTKSVRFTIE